MSQQETRIVYCTKHREHHTDSEQGSLNPIIEETRDGLIEVDKEVYVNSGLIHVTRGYHNKFAALPDGTIFKVEATVSRAWNDRTENSFGMSKFVTFDNASAPAPTLTVCQLIKADYPNPKIQDGMRCSSKYLPVDLFFIKCINSGGKEVVVGPLSVASGAKKDEDGNFVFDYRTPDKPFGGEWSRVNEASHSTMEFEFDLIPEGSFVSVEDRDFLVNLEQLPFLSATLVDLSSNENIIKWAAKLLRQSGSSKSAVTVLKKIIDEIPTDAELPIDIYESRKSRITAIQKNLSKIEGFGQVITDYMKSDEGQLIVKQHVETNRNTLLEMYSAEALEKEISFVKEQAEREYADITREIKRLQGHEKELNETIEELKGTEAVYQKETLQTEVKKLREEKGLVSAVDELRVEKRITEREIQILNQDKSDASNLLSEIQSKIGMSEESHKLKLIELKMGLEAISGNVKPESDIKADISSDEKLRRILATDSSDAKHEIITCISDALHNRGRVIDFDEVAVLLTCITQNLMVTLAGQPGSGKSSAVTELSSVLGLNDRNRYVRVQVQRGWTSDRDLLGFYNKLSHYYDPDRFGLYKLINGLQEIPTHSQLSIALLDEANLSPIEHYWSGFMGACDDPASFSTQGSKMNLPRGLRFISTVNYDRTTEPLSSRFIDRSPVIYIENKRVSVILAPKASIETSTEDTCNYSFDEIEKLFGRNDSAEFTSDESRIIEQILENHQFVSVKHRKINSLRQFTSVLRDLLSTGSTEKLNAIDYAILVNIIPLINGQGREYGKQLTDFWEFLQHQGLQHSAERTKHIIERSLYDAYSYFS